MVTMPGSPECSVPPRGTTAKTRKAGITDRYGASRNTNRSARLGIRSSLKISFMPSASVWRSPNGPARLGPMRFCMSEMTLRSNQTMKITDTSSTTKVISTLPSVINTSARPTPST